jgi:hypothetical protein
MYRYHRSSRRLCQAFLKAADFERRSHVDPRNTTETDGGGGRDRRDGCRAATRTPPFIFAATTPWVKRKTAALPGRDEVDPILAATKARR